MSYRPIPRVANAIINLIADGMYWFAWAFVKVVTIPQVIEEWWYERKQRKQK